MRIAIINFINILIYIFVLNISFPTLKLKFNIRLTFVAASDPIQQTLQLKQCSHWSPAVILILKTLHQYHLHTVNVLQEQTLVMDQLVLILLIVQSVIRG